MTYVRLIFAAWFASALCGCGSGASVGASSGHGTGSPTGGSTATPTGSAAPSGSPAANASASPAAGSTATPTAPASPSTTPSPVIATPTPLPTPTAGTSLYVVNETTNVLVFPLAASGNVAPSLTLSSSAITDSSDAALDNSGDLYVANFSATADAVAAGNVLFFPAPLGASSTPTTLSYAGFYSIVAIALDASNNLYVLASTSSSGSTYEILVFPPGASGNASPTRTITSPQLTGMGTIGDIAVDASTIYVAVPLENEVLQFPLNSNGVVTANALTGSATTFNEPMNIRLDYLDRLVVLNFGNQTLLRFPVAATGNTAPLSTLNVSSFDPMDDSAALCLDDQGNAFIANGSTSAVGFFPLTDTGSASPARTLTGAMTTLAAPDACTVR
jgi:hypothetical protein